MEHLTTPGVQQSHREDRIAFSSLSPWPGEYVCAEGRYLEGDDETGIERRAAVFIGPEFGTVSRPDLVAAARVLERFATVARADASEVVMLRIAA